MIRADTGPGDVSPTHVKQAAVTSAMTVEEFFVAHADRLEAWALYSGATSDADAEDAVSLAMIDMLKPGRWETISDPVRYANRAVLSHVIKRKNQQRRMIPLAAEHESSADDPELLEWEIDQWLQQMLESLPPKQREVVECHLLGGETYQEMQARTGRRAAALRRSMADALISLRAIGMPQAEDAQIPAAVSAKRTEETR